MGTVCLSRTASIGYVTVMDRPMATSQDFVNWVCGPEIDPDFLMYLLVAEKGALRRFSKGSTHSTIYFPEVQAFRVCAPERDEQRRVVAKLDALRARSQRAKDALDAVPTLLDRLRQSILAAAFRGDLTAEWRDQHPDVEPATELLKRIRVERRKRWEEAELAKLVAKGKPPKDDRWKDKYVEPGPVDDADLPELPDTWCWATMSELSLSISYGYTASANAAPVGPRLLRITDIQDDAVEWSSVPYCECDDVPSYALKNGDLVIARTGATTGKAYLVEGLREATVFASYLIRCETSHELPARFLWAFTRSPDYWGQISVVSKGTAQPGANATILGELVVPVPPATEAAAIIRSVDHRLAIVERAAARVGPVAGVLGNLDAAVLAAAFRGELLAEPR
jgi:type I restriction enzyme S subunit